MFCGLSFDRISRPDPIFPTHDLLRHHNSTAEEVLHEIAPRPTPAAPLRFRAIHAADAVRHKHSRASFCASAIWAGVICLAVVSRSSAAGLSAFVAARHDVKRLAGQVSFGAFRILVEDPVKHQARFVIIAKP